MKLEIVAGFDRDRPAQVVRLALVGWQLVEIPYSHVAAEIQLAILALSDGKSTARIELSENGRISSAGFREEALVVTVALALARRLVRS